MYTFCSSRGSIGIVRAINITVSRTSSGKIGQSFMNLKKAPVNVSITSTCPPSCALPKVWFVHCIAQVRLVLSITCSCLDQTGQLLSVETHQKCLMEKRDLLFKPYNTKEGSRGEGRGGGGGGGLLVAID